MENGLYKKVEVLNSEAHGSLKVNPIKGFEYAKELTNCAITISEFIKAKSSLPIVFVKNDSGYSAIVMLGLSEKNSFVDTKNNWKEGAYVPAFVRRYPFVFANIEDKLALGIDTDCKAVNKKSGQALFNKDNSASEYAQSVMKFMESYQKDYAMTSDIIAQLDSLGVLEDAQLNINNKDNNKILKGFKRVNREKLNALDDKSLSNMLRNGVYDIILAHLESLENFNSLDNSKES